MVGCVSLSWNAPFWSVVVVPTTAPRVASPPSRNAVTVPFVGLVVLVAGLVVAEPDLGTAIVVIAIALAMYFVAGARVAEFAALGGLTTICVAVSRTEVLPPHPTTATRNACPFEVCVDCASVPARDRSPADSLMGGLPFQGSSRCSQESRTSCAGTHPPSVVAAFRPVGCGQGGRMAVRVRRLETAAQVTRYRPN